MADVQQKNVVYLFGAGATQAEIDNIDESLVSENVKDEINLLMREVSKRVFKVVQQDGDYMESIDSVSRPEGGSNVELFVTLLENNDALIRNSSAKKKADLIRQRVKEDITGILTSERMANFTLHKALFELTKLEDFAKDEKVTGILSLNYDCVLDEAYKEILGPEPDYGFPVREPLKGLRLLKLHGSFGWPDIPIIPLGAGKNYLQLPYNYLWGQALELLKECALLRVIGCALSPNDFQLIDLLFKSHLMRGTPFQIEIINRQSAYTAFHANYDFFRDITSPEEVETRYHTDGISRSGDNPFKGWLKAVANGLPENQVEATKYLKNLILATV